MKYPIISKGIKMINRQQALTFLKEKISNPNIIKHMLATEAIMRALAKRFEPDKEEEWALAGLLHDADYSPQVPAKEQGIKVNEMLKEKGFQVSQEVQHAMAAHNWHETGVEPQSKMAWSLFCCDSLTGLIVAVALVRPEKKLALVTLENIKKKWKDKSFAAGTRREDIALCQEKLGIPLDEFISLSLEAMKKIADSLGL